MRLKTELRDTYITGVQMFRRIVQCIKIVLSKTGFDGILNVILFFLEGVSYLFRLLMLQNMINVLTVTMSTWKVIMAIGLYIVSLLPEMLLSYFRSQVELAVTKKLVASISLDIARKINSVDYMAYEDDALYMKYSRMGDEPYEKIKELFLKIMQTVKSFLTLLATFVIVQQYSVQLGLLFIVMLVLTIVLSTKGMNIYNRALRKKTVDERWSEYYKSLLYDKNTNFELRLNNAVSYIDRLRMKHDQKIVKHMFVSMLKADIAYNLSTVLVIAWSAVALVCIYNSILIDAILIGTFVALLDAILSMMVNVEIMSSNFSDVVQGVEYINYFNEFMALPEADESQRKHDDMEDSLVRVDHLSFCYTLQGRKILNDVTFSIKRNETLAIVGENGAGKSTLLKVLCGLLRPTEGEVIYASDESGKNSVVFQDYSRYWMTLRENIRISDISKTADDENIEKALQFGCCGDFMDIFKSNFDCEIGRIDEKGVELSGGQWQRIAIARGGYLDSHIIFLDEPTASMDPITESKMYQTFKTITKNRTCLIISHRLAMAKIADRIVFLNDGKICEIGTHDELMNKGGMYFKMYNLQAGWFNEVE